MKVEVCVSPALYQAYADKDAVVVVVDIFRATTSVCVAMSNGAKSIIPVSTIAEAESYKAKGYLVGAERNVLKCDFADFGNSPFDYSPENVAGREIAFTTTNGTRAIDCASDAYSVVIASFLNLQSVAGFCENQQRNVVILCSGWQDRLSAEDTLFAGALAERLLVAGFEAPGDSVRMALLLWQQAKPDLTGFISQTEHYQRLITNNLQDQVQFCLTIDTMSCLPVCKDGKIVRLF